MDNLVKALEMLESSIKDKRIDPYDYIVIKQNLLKVKELIEHCKEEVLV